MPVYHLADDPRNPGYAVVDSITVFKGGASANITDAQIARLKAAGLISQEDLDAGNVVPPPSGPVIEGVFLADGVLSKRTASDETITSVKRRGYYDLQDDLGVVMDAVQDNNGNWTGTDNGPAFLAALLKGQADRKELRHSGGDMLVTTQVNPQAAAAFQLRGVDPNLARVIWSSPATSGNGMPLLPTGGYGSGFILKTNLTADAAKGDFKVTVAAVPSSIVVGDLVNIGSTKLFRLTDHNAYSGELARVVGKTSTDIQLDRPLQDSYAIADVAVVQKVVAKKGLLVEGLQFINAKPNTSNDSFLRAQGYLNPVFRDLIFQDPDAQCIEITACDGGMVDHVHFLDGHDEPDRNGFVYGISLGGPVQNVICTNVYARQVRHTFTTAGSNTQYGVPRDCQFSSMIAELCTNAAFDTHAEGERMYLSNLVAHNCRAFGLDIRSPDTTVRNVTIYDSWGPGVLLRAPGCELSGIRVHRSKRHTVHLVAGDEPGSDQPGSGFQAANMAGAAWSGARISDIFIEDSEQDSFLVTDGVSGLEVNNLTIKNPGGDGVKMSGTGAGHRFTRPKIHYPTTQPASTFCWDIALTQTDVEREAAEYTIGSGVLVKDNPAGTIPRERFRRLEKDFMPGLLVPEALFGTGGVIALSGTTLRGALFRPQRDMRVAVASFLVSVVGTNDDPVEVAIFDVTANLASPPLVGTTGAVNGKTGGAGVVANQVSNLNFTTPVQLDATHVYAITFAQQDSGGATKAQISCVAWNNVNVSAMFGAGSGIERRRFFTRTSTPAGSLPNPLTGLDATPVSASVPLIALREG